MVGAMFEVLCEEDPTQRDWPQLLSLTPDQANSLVEKLEQELGCSFHCGEDDGLFVVAVEEEHRPILIRLLEDLEYTLVEIGEDDFPWDI